MTVLYSHVKLMINTGSELYHRKCCFNCFR